MYFFLLHLHVSWSSAVLGWTQIAESLFCSICLSSRTRSHQEHGAMPIKEMQKGKSNYLSIFQASVSVTSINTLLTKASHMVKPKVKQESTSALPKAICKGWCIIWLHRNKKCRSAFSLITTTILNTLDVSEVTRLTLVFSVIKLWCCLFREKHSCVPPLLSAFDTV